MHIKQLKKMKITYDYSLFELAPNKPFYEYHKNKLKVALSKKDLGSHYPISCRDCDGKLLVVNGQHRFVARKELGLPIYYDLSDLSIEDERNAESLTKQWNMTDFVSYYSKMGNVNYVRLKMLEDESGWKAGSFYTTFKNARNGKVLFNEGKLIFTEEDYLSMKQILNFCILLTESLPFRPDRKVLIATAKHLSTVQDFDILLLCDKLIKNTASLYPCQNGDQYLEMFEKIYNRSSRKKILLRKIN